MSVVITVYVIIGTLSTVDFTITLFGIVITNNLLENILRLSHRLGSLYYITIKTIYYQFFIYLKSSSLREYAIHPTFLNFVIF
jgi:hypothetical protein